MLGPLFWHKIRYQRCRATFALIANPADPVYVNIAPDVNMAQDSFGVAQELKIRAPGEAFPPVPMMRSSGIRSKACEAEQDVPPPHPIYIRV